MGYRSSVYFVLPESQWEGLMAIGKSPGVGRTAVGETVEDWVDYDWVVEPDNLDYWQYSSSPPTPMHFGEIHGIKWYREPGGVVTAFENYLTKNVPHELWGMIFVGEEPQDTEFLGMPYEFDMLFERNVDMPGRPDAPKKEVEPKPIDPNLPIPINWLRSLLK